MLFVMPTVIDFTKHDRQIWEEELESFLPQRIFDAHAHLFWHDHLPPDHPKLKAWGDADDAAHRAWARRLYPRREIHYLYLGTPVPGIDVQRHNEFIARELGHDPKSRANLLVTPGCTADYIATTARRPGFIGLKPYRMFSVNGNPDTCRIREFFPEEQLEVANDLGLWVTMHLSRYHAAADREQPARSHELHDPPLPADQVDPRSLRAQFHLLADPRSGRTTERPAKHLLRFVGGLRPAAHSHAVSK